MELLIQMQEIQFKKQSKKMERAERFFQKVKKERAQIKKYEVQKLAKIKERENKKVNSLVEQIKLMDLQIKKAKANKCKNLSVQKTKRPRKALNSLAPTSNFEAITSRS